MGTVIWDKLDAAFGLVIAVDALSNIADTSWLLLLRVPPLDEHTISYI